MNWLYYLLEANLYLAAFYLMYKLLLQNSTFYNSNRYFLILSIVVAFATPLIQLGFLKPQAVPETDLALYELTLTTTAITKISIAPTLTAEDYVFYGYLMLVLLLSLRFIVAISKITSIYIKGRKSELGGYTLVELATEHTAFSFFNVLFIHPNMAKNNAVLRHEIIHIQQKHSWDIVLLEFLKICCWFNPIIYLIKKDLTLLHEYIADANTTSATISKHEYAMFLIENSMASYSPSLVNQFFNQSILKSRINMLNKEKTANWARLKYLLAVPLGIGLLCASTLSFSKTYSYDLFPQQKVEEQKKQEKKSYSGKQKTNKEKKRILAERQIIIDEKNLPAPPAPPKVEAPPAVKKLKKFPPPVVKPNKKTETISLNEDQVLEIEFFPESNQKDVAVKGYKKTDKGNLEILKKEIEVAELSLAKNKNVQEIEVIPNKKVRGIKIEEKATKEVIVKGYKASEQAPTKKVQGLKIIPKDTLNKTGAIKKANNSTKEITTAKSALEKTNNVFNKAWTLYKSKAEDNKDDRC